MSLRTKKSPQGQPHLPAHCRTPPGQELPPVAGAGSQPTRGALTRGSQRSPRSLGSRVRSAAALRKTIPALLRWKALSPILLRLILTASMSFVTCQYRKTFFLTLVARERGCVCSASVARRSGGDLPQLISTQRVVAAVKALVGVLELRAQQPEQVNTACIKAQPALFLTRWKLNLCGLQSDLAVTLWAWRQTLRASSKSTPEVAVQHVLRFCSCQPCACKGTVRQALPSGMS